jgi:hypothetical protein
MCGLAPDIASPLAELATSAIAETTDLRQPQTYAAVIGAVVDKLDGVSATALVERLVPAIAETIDADQLQAYAMMIGTVADKLDGAAAHAVVERVVPPSPRRRTRTSCRPTGR